MREGNVVCARVLLALSMACFYCNGENEEEEEEDEDEGGGEEAVVCCAV